MRIRHEIFREKDSQSAESARLRYLRPIPETVHPIFSLQQQAGNQAVQHLLRSSLLQAKLATSRLGSHEGQQADRTANLVMRGHAGVPSTSPCTCADGGEMCEECQHKQKQMAACKSSATAEPAVSPGAPIGVSTGPAAAGAAGGPRAGPCSYTITYANIKNLGCPGGTCGAQIQYDITNVSASGSGCPADLSGLRITESVVTDNGCGPGAVQTGAGCSIGAGGAVTGCTDTYGLCLPTASVAAGGCKEIYTQDLSVGGIHAETHHITFKLVNSASGCSGTVSRS